MEEEVAGGGGAPPELGLQNEAEVEGGAAGWPELGLGGMESLSIRTCSSAPSSHLSVRSLSSDLGGPFPPMSEWEEIVSHRWLQAWDSLDPGDGHGRLPETLAAPSEKKKKKKKRPPRRWLLRPLLHPRAASRLLSSATTATSLFSLDPISLSVTSRSTAAAESDGGVGIRRFSLRELLVATDSFSSKNIIGRGGFGKVYKGRLANGSLVAVKRLKEELNPGAERQFQTEVEMIGMALHRNLLRPRGFCTTPTERLVVYPYMANGSVASWLRERPASEPPLDWPTRRRIALGSARGLSYLHDHCDPKIIHRDVKAANILLDEEFEAVVGDFGLVLFMDCGYTHVTTDVRGTVGHIAPEYVSTGECSERTDVFGYGIMLLELITGHRAFYLARLANDYNAALLAWVDKLQKWKMLADLDLPSYVEGEVKQLIQVAMLCTLGSPMDRPKMSEVVRMLEGDSLAERWEEWQRAEVTRPKVELPSYDNFEWIFDSADHLCAYELSGPR